MTNMTVIQLCGKTKMFGEITKGFKRKITLSVCSVDGISLKLSEVRLRSRSYYIVEMRVWVSCRRRYAISGAASTSYN
jgi:hypothetical protein